MQTINLILILTWNFSIIFAIENVSGSDGEIVTGDAVIQNGSYKL